MSSCFYFTDPMRKAEKALQKGNCKQVKRFFLLVQNDKKMKFAEKAAKACVSKSIKEAIWFYDYLSEREKDIGKRISIKEHLADLYFKKERAYEKAIEEYSFLKKQDVSEGKRGLYSFHIALSYFESGKWEMSLKETEKLLSLQLDGKNLLNALFLKARTLLMQEKYIEAEKAFRQIQQVDSVYFEKNKLFLYLSFIYESQKEFHQAIIELRSFQNTSEFLTDKIKRLEIRQSKQPGAVRF